MNVASILSSLNDAKTLLKEAELFKDINRTHQPTLNVGKFSEEFIKISQKDDYELIYRTAMKNLDYDFLLVDDSFFQFSCTFEGDIEKGEIRYAYFQNPREYPTYEEFLSEMGFNYVECGEEFLTDYEQEIMEAKLSKSVTPIRYDYNYRLYRPVEHTISHIHIGHNNEVRISTGKILTPAKFTSFVLRNVYPDLWNKAYKNDSFKELCLATRRACHQINGDYFNDEEKGLLHIV